jgi:hypothetical protein
MRQIRSFVVRVYRNDEKGLWGVVQDVASGCSHSFHSPEHLWMVLSAAHDLANEPATQGKPQ